MPSRIALAIAAMALAAGIVRLLLYAIATIPYPYDLDYGEGVVWQQMRQIFDGTGYAPLGLFPAVVFEYPPLFHVVTGVTARLLGSDPLATGRTVSFVATIALAALVGRLTATSIGTTEDARVRRIAAILAALWFATLPTVLSWSALMRVDMLAYALTLLGMLLAGKAGERPAWAIGAGVAFTLALYARQTCLPAPAAAFTTLLASSLLVGSALLLALQLATHGQFLVHILFYNINRIIWDHAPRLALVLLTMIVTLALGTIGLMAALRRIDVRDWRGFARRCAADRGVATLAIVVLTLALKTVMLPAILKSGASDNYLIDWLSEICVLVGMALIPLIRAAFGLPASTSVLLLALVGIGLPVQITDPAILPDITALARDRAVNDALAARIRLSDKPVITDQMVLLQRGGQPMRWEPAITAELGSAGVYDEPKFARMVRRGDFAFFVTEGDRGTLLFDQRFNPRVADAIDAAYPDKQRIGKLVIHAPAAR